jgi:hypothetical protein
MSRHHREHPDMEPDAATERLYEMADRLRDERKDAAWEKVLERDAGPWDKEDAFSLAKEAKWFDENPMPEIPSKSHEDALTSKYGTESHRHD